MSTDPSLSQKSTEGMVDYNQNSSAQQHLVHILSDRIRSCVEDMARPSGEFRVADFGCGPGVSTIETVKPSIAACAQRFDGLPIAVCHVDQVGNDWNTLFDLAKGPTGYGQMAPDIRTEAVVGSFYDRSTAPGTVSISTCIFASHWLSHAMQVTSPGSVWFADLEGQAREDMRALAQSDWTRFLEQRAIELHSGGYLIVGTLGSVPDPAEINGIAASGRGIYRALHRVADEMVRDNLIPAVNLENFVFSLWFLTKDEAAEALHRNPDLAAAFEICEIDVQPAPIKAQDIFEEHLADPKTYAEKYVGYTRAFADSTLRTQLMRSDDSDPQTLEDLMSTFYNRLRQLYETETNTYACEVWHLIVVLKRK